MKTKISNMRPTLMAAVLAVAGISGNASAQELMFNEIQVANTDQFVDPSFNYGPWVELYNPTSRSINITGWYFSDDPDNLLKGKIKQTTSVPAHGRKVLWFDNHSRYAPSMIDMKPDVNGGTLYLTNAQGEVQLTLDYPAQIARTSWARTTDGGDTWSFCATPTPEASNDNASYASERLAAPVIDQPSQIFQGSVTLNIDIPEGCTLRFTTNGSTPTLDNGSTNTTGTLTTSITRVYRFALFRDGYLPSPVVTRTMIKREHDFDIPVLAICSSNANYYGNELGIFCRGTNGRPGRGQSTKCNWNMDWERPSNFELYMPDGTCVINQEVNVERCGGWSRAWEPYSFKVKANKEYEGKKSLDYAFFDSKPFNKHKALQIRNGGNDNQCRVKDPGLQEIIRTSGLYVDGQAYEPVAHYINGTYKGTINMRQPNNKDYAYSDYGLDDDYLDCFEMSPDSGYVQTRGTKDSFLEWYNLSKSCSNDGIYRQICDIVDIDEYINYMAVQFFIGGDDWPQNNVKGFKSTLDGGKWHFVLFDLDHGFNQSSGVFTTFANKKNYTFDYMYGVSPSRITAEIELVTIFLNMLNNSTFRKQFIDAFCLVAGSVFEPERSKQIITDICNRVAPMQGTYNWESPWSTGNYMIGKITASRRNTMISALKNYDKFKLTGVTAQEVTLKTNLEGAHISVNGLPVPTDRFDGKLFKPVVLNAEAPEGYVFTGWKKAETNNTTVFAKRSSWKYYDQGSLDGQNWQSESYNDGSWKDGAAPLGYYTGGSRDYQTTLSYGSNTNNKYPTYYFRKNIELSKAPTSDDVFTLGYTIDDGFVIYVNGSEAGRYNMPSGNISYGTFASSYAENNPDSGNMRLDASLFHAGANVIAVEIHNNSASSSDVYWDAELNLQNNNGSTVVCETAEYTLPTSGKHHLIACFEPIPEAERHGTASHPVVINELSAQNDTYVNEFFNRNDWLELYNTTSEDIDLTGMYLTDNLSKPQKFQITRTANENMIIPAHGYKIIWCDKLAAESQIHASFKLGNDNNSAVMLTAADGSWADTLRYDAHTSAQTVGRYPDASDNIYVLERATIGSANAHTTSDVAYSRPDQNPDSIEQLETSNNTTADDHYRVFDLSGTLVAEGDGSVHITDLSSGAYILRRGNESIKVIR